jgi:hypothetical protein
MDFAHCGRNYSSLFARFENVAAVPITYAKV